MTIRLLRGAGVLAVMLLGLACGGGSTDEATAAPVDLMSHSPAAHIVCSNEDPCPKGFICLGHIRCAQLCKNDGDCPTGQTCSGQTQGKKFCQ
jgi:hypothetical protein